MADAPAAPPVDAPPRGRPLWLAVLAALITGLALFGVHARTQGQAEAAGATTAPAELLGELQARGTSLTAVGRAVGLDRPCTAWLVDAGADLASAAYAVTAGRCVGIDDSATVLAGVPLPGAAVELSTFAAEEPGEAPAPVTIPVVEVVWASVRGTDLAVLRLGATYRDLDGRGIRPIRPVAPLPESGQVLIAGVPVEGVPEDQQRLRGSRCAVGVTTDVAEVPWLVRDVQASGCVGILEGSAGSPAFNPQGEAVGMVSTTTIGAEQVNDCAPGRPCEVGQGTVSFRADTSYLVAVGGLGACFPQGVFDHGGSCPLEDPDTVVDASAASATVPAGERLEVAVDPDQDPAPSVKVGMLGTVDCWESSGWRAAVRTDEGALIATAPQRQGLALVCVGSAQQPTPLLVTVSRSAPDPGGIELAQVRVEGGIRVRPVADAPEYSTFAWTSGPAGTTDCASAEGYVAFSGQPALIEAADLPSTVCVIAYDEAGIPSAPRSFEVG